LNARTGARFDIRDRENKTVSANFDRDLAFFASSSSAPWQIGRRDRNWRDDLRAEQTLHAD
jgi:hypothetical protein